MKHYKKNPHRDTKKYERYELIGWKKAAKQAADNTCYVSGLKQDLEVHHANASFSEIFNEALHNLDLEYHPNTEDYTQEELDALTNEVLALHEKAIAVVLHKDVHKQLHQKYGTHVDMEQINNFKAEYNGGKWYEWIPNKIIRNDIRDGSRNNRKIR